MQHLVELLAAVATLVRFNVATASSTALLYNNLVDASPAESVNVDAFNVPAVADKLTLVLTEKSLLHGTALSAQTRTVTLAPSQAILSAATSIS